MATVNVNTSNNTVTVSSGVTTVVQTSTKGPKGDRGLQGLQGIPGNTNTGSLFVDASVTGSTINLEKGDGTIVSLTVNTGSNTVSWDSLIDIPVGIVSSSLGTTNWNYDKEYVVRKTEQLTFSGDYILEDSTLLVEGDEIQIEYSPNKYFKKEGTIFIGGNLLIKDSVIENDGLISVGGQVILIGNSQIVGNGIII